MSKTLKIIAGATDKPLQIGGITIPCYVLENETRVLTQTGMVTGLGMSRGSNPNMGGDRISNFANGKSIKPLFNSGLLDAIRSPVKFKISNITTAYGYPATMLADICDVVLTARNEGILQAQQQHIAQRCELLVRGFARVGIIALVDEATGYQELRAKTALATILEKFIARELQPWTKTFPYEFYGNYSLDVSNI